MTADRFPTLSKEAGTTREPYRNHRGTTLGLPVPGRGKALKGPPRQPNRPVPATNPFAMTDPELLDCLGPSWRQMTAAQRQSYPARPR